MNENKKILIIPQPKILVFKDRWFKCDGIKNLPEFLVREFDVPRGNYKVEKISGEGTGLEIQDGKIRIWGDENICYSSIIQLLKQNPGYLPEVYIEEKFNFSFRGYHLDIGRGGIPNLNYFKKLLRLSFLLKYTHLAIYFEDLFPWKKYPQIGEKRGRLTENELKDIIDYARKLGIEVFPSLEFAGHMENILTIPEFSKYSEWHRPQEGCLNLNDAGARKFVYELLSEVLDFFKSSKFIHIGGDETWALGRGKSLNKTKKFIGPELYEMHHKHMIEMVLKENKIPVLWGDMLDAMYLSEEEKEIWRELLKSNIWDKVIIANWGYAPETKEYYQNKIKIFKKRKQFVCPGLSNWNTFYPDYRTAISNLTNFLQAGKEEKTDGFLITSWGDNGAECLYSLVEPLLTAGMEIAEGDSQWEEKWLALSGEPQEILNLRTRLSGLFPINEFNIKNVLFENKTPDKKLYQEWSNFLDYSRKIKMPDDLKFICNLIETGIKKIDGKLKYEDIYSLSREYKNLWLKERKEENLNKVLNKFNPLTIVGI